VTGLCFSGTLWVFRFDGAAVERLPGPKSKAKKRFAANLACARDEAVQPGAWDDRWSTDASKRGGAGIKRTSLDRLSVVSMALLLPQTRGKLVIVSCCCGLERAD
jgi:hypothetical protein